MALEQPKQCPNETFLLRIFDKKIKKIMWIRGTYPRIQESYELTYFLQEFCELLKCNHLLLSLNVLQLGNHSFLSNPTMHKKFTFTENLMFSWITFYSYHSDWSGIRWGFRYVYVHFGSSHESHELQKNKKITCPYSVYGNCFVNRHCDSVPYWRD